jgi:hypothetical protein
MSVDGLRAWIGEVERKLTMRTRVFLVLAVLAIGAAGAALYFAIDTREDAVSEGDVQELQQRLEGEAGTGALTGGANPTALQSEVAELRSRLEALEQADKAGGNGSGAGLGAGGSSGSTGGAAAPPGSSKLRQALEEAK